MHLDLSPLLSAKTLVRLDALTMSKCQPLALMYWDKWVLEKDSRHMPTHELQACAQYLSSCGCLLASLSFGLYCSRYYQTQGAIISDDVADYYLHLSFMRIHQEQGELLQWLVADKGHCYLPFFEHKFWQRACKAFLHHKLAQNNPAREAVIDFAISFVDQNHPNDE